MLSQTPTTHKPEMQTTVCFLLFLLVAFTSATCPSIPRTGCFQSTNVDATIRSNFPSNFSAYDWIWTKDNIDYGLPVEFPTASEINPIGSYSICVYSGLSTTQSETVAPLASSTIGYFPAVVGANLIVTSTSISLKTFGLGRYWALGLSSEELSNSIVQLIDPDSNKCWGKTFSFKNVNPPPVKPSGYLDVSTTPDLLNSITARLNAKSGGQSLNMISFSAATGPADLFQLIATSSLTGFNLKSYLSAYHVLGWYGGLWFLRDGFSGIPPGAAGPTLDVLDNVYASVDELVVSQNPTAIASYLEATTLNPAPAPAFGSPSDTVGGYGYNTGYSLQVIEAGASIAASTGNSGFIAPSGALNCPGTHPSCSFAGGFPNCPVPTGTSLVGCTFSPQTIPATSALASSLSTYQSAFPTPAANLLTRQNNAEPVGRQVWLFLSSRIAVDPVVYQTLYGVNNAFLETLQVTALLAFDYAIQTPGSAESLSAGTRAVIATGAGKGWLTSYNYALYSSSGGLPQFDFGTTPISVV
eukprot:TRINITY_DN221_c0_g1_i1.p1 TRINITY_DN221_c0_g1~~TRINITY_DN221_c0_g1_i1.p1  ORF type:complete len:527 (+),score=114.90 TRINITY_DN221_c0_g1_i1:15-1595(+)